MASFARSKRQRGAATVASSSRSSNSYNKAAKKKKKRQRKEGVKDDDGGEFDLCDAATLSWLAGCDPSVQWMTSQVAPAAVAEALAGSKTGTGGTHEDNVTEVCQERIMDPKSGSWVSKIMAKQDPKTHLWAVDPARVAKLKGAPLTPSEMYTPKWTNTFYTLKQLALLGAPPGHAALLPAVRAVLDSMLTKDGYVFVAKNLPKGELCITGMLLYIACTLGALPLEPRLHAIPVRLAQLTCPDGGWNCRAVRANGKSKHSSFHTTQGCLEGLLAYTKARRQLSASSASASASGSGIPKDALSDEALAELQSNAQEFMLVHKLYKSHRTGAIADDKLTTIAFPPRWRQDILRGLVYFADADVWDERLQDAYDLLLSKRLNPTGGWRIERRQAGAEHVAMERPSKGKGKASALVTARALRVVQWWQSAAAK